MTYSQAIKVVKRSQIVAEARKWIKTPFLHQGRKIGAGVDCAGLVVGVNNALGLVLDYEDTAGYPENPANKMIEQILDRYLIRKPKHTAQAGDVLFFRYAKLPQHLGILTDVGTIVHAYKKGPGVVEVTYDRVWDRCTVRAYEFPGVE